VAFPFGNQSHSKPFPLPTCFKCNATGKIAQDCVAELDNNADEAPDLEARYATHKQGHPFQPFTAPQYMQQVTNDSSREPQWTEEPPATAQEKDKPKEGEQPGERSSSPTAIQVTTTGDAPPSSHPTRRLPCTQAQGTVSTSQHPKLANSPTGRSIQSPLEQVNNGQTQTPFGHQHHSQPQADRSLPSPNQADSRIFLQDLTVAISRGDYTPPSQQNKVPSASAIAESDIEMADFSKHDLIMIQCWQQMHGPIRGNRAGLLPPKMAL
jgi:hypothetical protein